jgi:hypothetical protein
VSDDPLHEVVEDLLKVSFVSQEIVESGIHGHIEGLAHTH